LVVLVVRLVGDLAVAVCKSGADDGFAQGFGCGAGLLWELAEPARLSAFWPRATEKITIQQDLPC
jgi:hypothetical protein